MRVDSMEEFIMLLKRGESLRFKRSTVLNERSSRSHTVIEFCLHLDSLQRRPAKLLLCDLAGSEKYTDSNVGNKSSIAESTSINKSLAALGRYAFLSRVVQALHTRSKDPKREVTVPYRDSKLTRVLQNCLNAESRSYLLTNFCPSESVASAEAVRGAVDGDH